MKQLFKGVGVIIDDEAGKKGKQAYQILISLQKAHIPMVVYKDIPDISVIEALGSISFVILDWDFSSGTLDNLGLDEEEYSDVNLPDGFQEEKRRTILEFLKVLLQKTFVPVFIFTGQRFEDVKESLVDEGVYQEGKPNRILLKHKDDIPDYNSLIRHVGEWLDTTPSAHVLKLWESEAVISKNKMFLDLYSASPNWVSILLRILKADAHDNRKAVNQEFVEILNNNFVNRISPNSEYYSVNTQTSDDNSSDIRSVLQGERYIKYDQECLPDICYVGDLYRKSNDPKFPYRLNIRAQCDLSRCENPNLYLIPGKVFSIKQVTAHPGIEVIQKNEDIVLKIDESHFILKDLLESDVNRNKFNKGMKKYNAPVVFSNGDIIEKKTHSIIPCIAEETLVEFSFREFEVKKKQEIEQEATLIGRLLPPYITKVQRAFASFITRAGTTPFPDELII